MRQVFHGNEVADKAHYTPSIMVHNVYTKPSGVPEKSRVFSADQPQTATVQGLLA